MKALYLIPLFFSIYSTYSQNKEFEPDSIEYCLWQQIFDFKLHDDKYYFSDFKSGQIVESDSLIFNSTKYFDNFSTKTDYVDSVRLAIISRTMKHYGEPILYKSLKPYVRIAWLKEKTPIFITLYSNNDSTTVVYKEGNGSYDFHGNIVKLLKKSYDLRVFQNSVKLINKSDFYNLKHGIRFCHKEDSLSYLPDLFAEAFDGEKYNIVILDECNFDFDKYKSLLSGKTGVG